MARDRYIYPAVFYYDEDGISIEFPDLPGCLSCADTDEEALKNAKNVLGLYMYNLEKDGEEIPKPTTITKIKTQENEAAMLVEVWMPLMRETIENKSVRKNVTLPRWLETLADAHQVNYSQVLQNALKELLGVEKHN